MTRAQSIVTGETMGRILCLALCDMRGMEIWFVTVTGDRHQRCYEVLHVRQALQLLLDKVQLAANTTTKAFFRRFLDAAYFNLGQWQFHNLGQWLRPKISVKITVSLVFLFFFQR